MNLDEMPLSEIIAYLNMCDHYDRINAPSEFDNEFSKNEHEKSKKQWDQIRSLLMRQYFRRADKITSIL